MKKVLFLLVSIVILGLVLAGCGGISNIITPSSTVAQGVIYLDRNGVEPCQGTYPLYAGQDMLVGNVLVWHDGEELCVRYELSVNALAEGWLIYETHIAVGKDPSEIPQTKHKKNEEYGNPKVGHFPYGDDDLGGVEFYEECGIPIPDVDCDVPFVIAAHAVVESQTAWAAACEPGKKRFVDQGNWATYFEYTVECPECFGCPGIIDKSTNIELLDELPADVQVGVLESNEFVRVWKEFEGTLTTDLQYDLADGDVATNGLPSGHPYSLATGTDVCIFYVHFDSVGDTGKEQTGYLTFDANISGVILSGGSLGTFAGKDLMFVADDLLTAHTGTTYPDDSIKYPPNVDYLRGFEVNYGVNTDDVEIDGKTVDFTTWVSNAHDSFRVIVPMVPVPCE